MKRILGMGVGVVYIVFAYAAFSRAGTGYDAGHGDIAFWFSVVGGFLSIASLAAFIGTWIHTQEKSDAAH
jgi:ABC-type Na+ efflux pump permease subunit